MIPPSLCEDCGEPRVYGHACPPVLQPGSVREFRAGDLTPEGFEALLRAGRDFRRAVEQAGRASRWLGPEGEQ